MELNAIGILSRPGNVLTICFPAWAKDNLGSMFQEIQLFVSLNHDGSLQGPSDLRSGQYYEGGSVGGW
jgi:hypothetical protein